MLLLKTYNLPGWKSLLIVTEPYYVVLQNAAPKSPILVYHTIYPWSLRDGILSNIPDWLTTLSYVTLDYLSQLVLCYIKDVTNINHM